MAGLDGGLLQGARQQLLAFTSQDDPVAAAVAIGPAHGLFLR
jgi:hypothetical protein